MSEEYAVAAGPELARSRFPRDWTRWNGPPPADEARRAGWIRANIAEGEARRAMGENIGWLHRKTGPEALRQLEYRARSSRLNLLEAKGRLLELERKRPGR